MLYASPNKLIRRTLNDKSKGLKNN